MSYHLEVPALLNLPPKLLPFIDSFDDYRYFLLEGGRGSGKSQSVARFILYLCERYKLRVVCGRETQASIDESVYTILKDIISSFELNYTVQAYKIIHNESGSEINFKGFREQGSVNIKGLEGVDILWIDEAQAISKTTLDVLIPTIRRENSKLIFSMNRYMRDDAVYNFLDGRHDCLHIKINYHENPFCPLNLKIEAETLKNKNIRDYNHIWLGHPLSTADDFLFNYDNLAASLNREVFGDKWLDQRVVGIDFAAQGNDDCVATVLDRRSNQHWEIAEQIIWHQPDSMKSVGRIIEIVGEFKPTVTILDVGGMGHVVYDRLTEVGLTIHRFDGATTVGIDKTHYANARAEGYYTLRNWFDSGFLCIPERYRDTIAELEKIKIKFRSDGKRILQAKQDMRKEVNFSPDRADSLMMAVYGAVKYVGETNTIANQSSNIKRVNKGRRYTR